MSQSNEIQFTDRYQAAGIPYPDADTVCLGRCEGMGCVPVSEDEADPILAAGWRQAHAAGHTMGARIRRARSFGMRTLLEPNDCDGWHFVTCPDCDGTGKRRA